MPERNSADALIEAANSAFRVRDVATGRILPAAAWWDLAPLECQELLARQLASRALERAADPTGLSSTARAILSRLDEIDQL